jgi:hypothetical protein
MLCLIPVSVFAASAIGQKANYANAWPTIEYEADSAVSVGVHDQRPYVINGEKSPTYVGTVRARFGNPWNVNTESDKPLSEDIASAVVSGFMRVGIQAASVPISFSDDYHAAIGKLKQLGAKRIVLITLREWRSDSYRTAGLFINAVLQVYDEKGKELANSSTSHKNIGSGDGSVVSTYDAARSYLSILLNDDKIKAALGSQSVFEIREIGRDDRFIAYNNGTVLDTKTNLMWADKDNGSNINWKSAGNYCGSYRRGGYTDWRMPTKDELSGLYDSSKSKPSACESTWNISVISTLINISCGYLWASEITTRTFPNANTGATINFNDGKLYWYDWAREDYYFRALPVRSGKDSVTRGPEKQSQPPLKNAKSFVDEDKRTKGIKGIVLMNGDVIEGQILSWDPDTVKIRTKEGKVLSYDFKKEVQRFFTE